MLYFIGVGISGVNSLSLEARKIIERADVTYLEVFTSIIEKSHVEEFEKISTGEFKIAKRWMIEDGSEILKKSKDNLVVLVTYGDPFIATTHIELRVRAINEKITTKAIHGASAITATVGQCGLHYYKIGKITTIMDDVQSLTTPYYTIYKNLIEGNHTILLLEYNQKEDFFLNPNDALQNLIKTEQGQKRNVISEDTFVVIASRIGFDTQKITAGNISSVKKQDLGDGPHTVIISGSMHFTESDALCVLADCLDKPHDNIIKKISKQMLEKYIPMINDAIKEIEPKYIDSKEHQEVLENAKSYVQDAMTFLQEGRDEVAILSIGYADGLVDALRIAKGIDPKM